MPPAQNIFLVIDFSIRSNYIGPDDLEDVTLACFQVRNHLRYVSSSTKIFCGTLLEKGLENGGLQKNRETASAESSSL